MRSLPVIIPSFPVLPLHDQSSPIPGLLAIHIRHGDFIHHCNHFSKYGSSFNGFNRFPEFVDKIDANGDGSPQTLQAYSKACYPTIEQIMDKIREVMKTPVGSTLDRVYIMTNADNAWLMDLRKQLRTEANWSTIATKRDLDLTPEMTYVAQAFDMMIGQRSQVFIGNGVMPFRFIPMLARAHNCDTVFELDLQRCHAADGAEISA